MDSATFVRGGYEIIDLVINYLENVHQRTPLPGPDIVPGYMAKLIPETAPEKPETWEDIMKDIESVVFKGMSHWQHKMFFAYFPAGNSWPSIMGDIFSNAIGISGASWVLKDQSPVCTELEIIVLDWAAKFLGLPKFFLSHFSNPSSLGGGSIQTSASDSILLSMVAAREWAVKNLRKRFPGKPRAVIMRQLVGYCSSQCHSCVEKGALIGLIRLRLLEPDETGGLRADALRAAIKEDKDDGLVPFFHCAILGSTGICAFDDLMEIGPVCQEHQMWLHVDGAYAGSSFVCPEMRYLSFGMEYAWSFNTNCNKWMLTNFDCSLHWFKERKYLIDCLTGNDESLHKHQIIDFRHWGVAGTRRFRAFKLWVVIRNYGIRGIQNYVRSHIYLSKLFERYVMRDLRFETVGVVRVGLVCFRLKGTNEVNKRLLEALNSSRRIHMIPSAFHDKYVIRFAVCSEYLNEDDIHLAWSIIEEYASVVIRLYEIEMQSSPALKALFGHQHEHDEEGKLHYNPKQEAEEKEALEETQKMMAARDDLIKRADPLFNIAAFVSDSISFVDDEGIEEYDKYIFTHPETLEEKEVLWPSKKNRGKYFMDGHLTFEDDGKPRRHTT